MTWYNEMAQVLTRRLLWVAPVLLMLSVTGCASNSTVMQSWVGHNEGDLIAAWGPPQAEFSDGRGGKILAYYSHVNAGQIPGTYGNGYYTAPTRVEWDRSRMFYVDALGVIYSWRWQGL